MNIATSLLAAIVFKYSGFEKMRNKANKKGWFSPTHSSLYKFELKLILVDVCFSPATHAQATHGNTQNFDFTSRIESLLIIQQIQTIIQQIFIFLCCNMKSSVLEELSPTTCVCLRTLMIGNPGTNKSLSIAFSYLDSI